MEVYFIVAHIEGGSKKFKLNNGEFVILGRSESGCQVILDDPICSSRHCKISMSNNAINIEDLNSKNGIFLNGVRIIKQNLFIGDKLKVGSNIIYILESKLSDSDKAYLTYKGGGLRKAGDLTFEVDAPNITNRNLGRQSRSKAEPENRGNNKKRIPIDFVPSRNVSKSKMAFLDLLAYLVDLSLSLLLFIVGVKSFAYLFTSDFEKLSKSNSLLKIMFSDELGVYTLIVFILSSIFFFWNRKRPKGSFGERMLKIN